MRLNIAGRDLQRNAYTVIFQGLVLIRDFKNYRIVTHVSSEC